MLPQLLAHPLSSARKRLSAKGYLAFELALGALLLVVAVTLFGEIADQVVDADELTRFDNALAAWIHERMGGAVMNLMVKASAMHSTLAVTIYVFVFAGIFVAQRNWHRLQLLIALIPFGMLLNVVLKQAFHRTRPAFADLTNTLTSYSFPSGHTMAATVLWSFIVMWAWPYCTGWLTRLLLIVLACMAVLLVGFSRIYLGAHFLSDVLAAMCEGIAWSALCGIAFGVWRRRRAAGET